MATISFHIGTTTSISHNNRHHVSGNPDIDLARTKNNIYYIQRDIREVYSENFDRAVSEYNQKQKRSDRKIDDYYSKILQDKKTHHQRELIVAIGSKDDLAYGYSESRYNQVKGEILDEYMKGFEKRNPNLKVYNAVMHLDEANPHLHINYVPVYESKRGLKKRVGHDKALEQQGYADFEMWRECETKVIEELLEEKRIKRDFKDTGEHLDVREYKKVRDELKHLREEKNELWDEVFELRDAIRRYKETDISYKTNFLGEVKLSPKEFKEFQELVKSAKSYDDKFYKLEIKEEDLEEREEKLIEKERELKQRELDDPILSYKTRTHLAEKESERLLRENQKLLAENKELKKEINEKEDEIKAKDSLLKDAYFLIESSFVKLNKIRESDQMLKLNDSLTAFTNTLKKEAIVKMASIRSNVSNISYSAAREAVENVLNNAVRCREDFQRSYVEHLEKLKQTSRRIVKKQIDRGVER